ncbi:MAG TPA: peptidoglycan DD-metalloendopeptidase family protein, partial [Burkholderiales bacterium]|nr:peptidoglycan DD-metalloendopeptidase family protein [Burkholderiales bacterium]
NIIILDHGNGYMSLYADNETLLRKVGDRVHGGDAIAEVGNSGGNEESGLYFELRDQGVPLDPMKWVTVK